MSERDLLADLEATRQDFYKNAQLPQAKASFGRDIRKIQAAGITSYTAAYQFLMDTANDPKLRHILLFTLFRIWGYGYIWQKRTEYLDRQEIMPALVVSLKDRHPDIRHQARQLVEYLELRECVPHLLHMIATDKSRYNRIFAMTTLAGWQDPDARAMMLAIVADRSKSDFFRTHAIFCLWQYPIDPIIQNLLETILVDPTESVAVREQAAEALADMGRAETVDAYLALLSEPAANLRLWGVSGLGAISSKADISSAIPLIDHVASTDNAVPPHWWSVASMAMRALELFWYQRLAPETTDESYLVSPLLEYNDFQEASWVYSSGDDAEFVPIQQTTTLSIDPATVAKQIVERWPDAKINVRHPQPEALILDWWMEGKESPLMGGLHRNGYWVFLSGDEAATLEFAVWLRDLIPAEYPLRIYGWADPGIEINATLGEIGFSEAERRARESWNEQLGKLVTEVNQMMEKANDQS